MQDVNSNIELVSILESIADAFFALDHQWRFTYVNSEAERVLQRPREQLLGNSVWGVFPEAIGSTFYTEYHRAVDERAAVEFEEYLPPLETWFEVKAYPSEVGLAVYFRDINQRKQTEEKLRRSEERLRAVLVQYGGDLISIVGADGVIRYMSPASEHALGYKPEVLVGTNVFERIHTEDLKLAQSRFAQRIENPGQGPELELRFQHADGSWRTFEAVANNLLDDPDVRGIVIHARDVTERKRTEKLLHERSEAIEASIDGVSIADLELGYTYVNQAHASMYGYDHPDELLGESWKVLYDEDGGRWMEQHTTPALEKEGYWQGEAIGKRRDGSTFPQEVSLTRVGEKFICLVRDITWRKEAERRLARLASYPELNPSPIVEVDSSRRLTYANPVAERLFPDLRVSGVDHPILAGYEDLNARFRESTDDVLLDETRVEKRFYQRVLSQVPGEDLYRIYCVDITTGKQMEEDLRKNEATLYEAQRVANIGSWEYSPQEDRATWSDQTYRIFGLSPGEPAPTYRQFVEFVHPDDRRALDRALKASLGDESPQSLDFRIIRTDGEVRWVNAQYEIVYDARTIPQRAVGTLHDITDRKLVEERLRESEASLIEAQRLAALGSWEAEPARPDLGTAEHGMRWSDEMFRLFGYAPQEFAPTFKDLVRATHPEDREHVKQTMRDSASRGESPVVVEHRIVRPDGEVRFLQAQIEMVYGPDGELNRNFGTVLDITRRRRAEEAQSRLAAIVESSQDAVFSETLDGIIENWNTGAEELYGYSAEEIVGQHISILTPPDLPDDAPEILNRVSLGDSVESRETVRVKKGGERLEISLTVSPMKDASGNIIGASTIARDITGRKALERQLEYQAFHDTLTGLPNRALLEDRIQHALIRIGRREEYVALLFMDLDDFKVVNDSLGHLFGDQLLVAVSRRLESVVRAEDTVARFGGDEFVILLEDTERAGEAAQVAGRIIETLRMPFLLGKEEVSTSVSIGISYGLFGQDSFEELLRQADVAMYEVKARSKGGYRIFEQRMGTRATERQTLGNDLRRALEREELVLHYQTKVEIETGDIVGSEALVRWNHPERGLLSPGEFIPLAEETGLIIPVGRWVFREACRQAKSWHEQHPKSSPMLVCVNVSAQEFQVPGLVEEMCRSIRETGVNPACMELEITESALMRYVEGTLRTLKEIRDLGMKIAIDDFGTGYSSLSYLQRFPADYLKIDRSFVNELDGSSESWAFISMIVDLARSLGMKTVAEGVETESQLSQLKEIGCDMAQGYYFTKPCPVNEIQAIIAENYNL